MLTTDDYLLILCAVLHSEIVFNCFPSFRLQLTEFHSKDYIDTLESFQEPDNSEDEQRLRQFGLGWYKRNNYLISLFVIIYHKLSTARLINWLLYYHK